MHDPAAVQGNERSRCERLFLPDFCGIRMVFAVVIIAELLAFVLVLARSVPDPDRWGDLSLVSLFIQWIALTSLAALCLARPWLCRVSNVAAAALSYLLLLAVTAAISEAAYWIARFSALDVILPPEAHAGFLLRNLGVSAIVSAMALRYFYVQHQWKRNVEAQAQARIQALQARIRPHFLFNSMNTIAALTRSRPEQAEAAVEDLSDLFRAAFSNRDGRTTLAEEVELAHRYLNIEKLRLGDRLRVEWALDGVPDGALLPSLTLQPLVENAIYHGVEPLPEGGTIRVEGRRDGKRVILSVRNPVPRARDVEHREGNRMALDNIRQRLALAYGRDAGLQVEEREAEYRVTLYFPLEEASGEGPDRG